MPIDIANECSVACRDVIQSTREALACGVVALDTGDVVSLHHVFPSLPRKEIAAVAEAVCEMFCGMRLRGLDRVLSRRLRNNAAFIPPSELYLEMPSAQLFLKSIRKRDMVAFLIAKRSANQGFGWLTLRKVVAQLRKAVTARISVKTGKIPGLERKKQDDPDSQPLLRRTVSHSATTFSGQLAQFGLTAVFQMLGSQKISGRLEVQSGREDVSIMFEDGQIVAAWEHDNSPGDGLMEVILRRLQLDEQTLRKVKRRSSFRGTTLIEALRELGHVDQLSLGKAVRALILERVYRAFEWTVGSYNFFPDRTRFEGVRCAPVDVEKTLFKVALMADEMPLLRGVLPSEDTEIQAVSQVLALQLESLEPKLQQVFHALPPRPLRLKEARKLIPFAEFETLKALVELHTRGYLTVDGVRGPDDTRAEPGPSSSGSHPRLRRPGSGAAHPRLSASGTRHPVVRGPRGSGAHPKVTSGAHPQVTSGAHPKVTSKAREDGPEPSGGDAAEVAEQVERRGGLVFTARPRTEERKVPDLESLLAEEEAAPEPEKPRTMTMRLDAIRAVARKAAEADEGSGNGGEG